MLEFHKLSQQVEHMGQVLAQMEEDTENKADIARMILEAYADEAYLPYIFQRVNDAVEKDAGYRGARPVDEPIMQSYPPAPLPVSATLIATDGSQIYPNRHGVALYYLINTGTIVWRHGSGEPPEVISQPYLFYEREYMYAQERGQITNATVDARRTVAEMAALAEHTWLQRGEARPLIALTDGPLLFIMSSEVPERDQLRGIYFSAMTRILEVKAALAGYVDRPSSSQVVRLLHLLDLQEDDVNRSSLATSGRMEGLPDIAVFRHVLEPGERTALFVQMSPQNRDYRREAGETHEIAFFYMNAAASGEPPYLARIEIPMWVARDKRLIGEMQAALHLQCQQLVRRYPYVLTRADELARVKTDEEQQLNMMIRVSLTRQGLAAFESDKQAGKEATRGVRTRFEVE